MRPISGGFDPYRGYRPLRRLELADRAPVTTTRAVRAGDASLAADVEVSVRVYADGRSISVRRQTVDNGDGTHRLVGIDAMIR